MLDKATFPRDKCCGDGLTTLALRELEGLGFDPGRITDWQPVDGAWLRSPSGREVVVPLPAGCGSFAAVAPRRQLDAELVELARRGGVDMLDGASFDGALDVRPDSVTVGGGGRTVTARYVVGADGMWSPVRKAAGLGERGYLGEWHAFRQYVDGVTGPAADRLYVWFDADLLPGYAWSFPLPGGRANLGFGLLRDGTRHIGDTSELWAGLADRPHVRRALGDGAVVAGRPSAWPIPARIDRVPLAAGRVVLVGDAAAASDVMTGEGIGQALLTGRLAAEAIASAGATRPDLAARRYRADVRHHLRADHRMSAALGAVLAHERGARGAMRVLAASGERGRRNFARWMFEDEPRAIALTPGRWHRRVLARPGAWLDRAVPSA